MDTNKTDVEILNKLKESLRIGKEKEIFSLFKVTKDDMTAENLLKALTKGDLDSIRKAINVTGTSSLKKNELAEHLGNHLSNNLEDIFKNYIALDEFQYINLIAQNNGAYVYTHSDNNYSMVKALRLLGISFPIIHNKVNKIIIPVDYLEQINNLVNSKEIEETVINNNKVIKIIKGLLYYYGVAPFDVLWEKIKSNIDIKMDKDSAFAFVTNYANRDGSIKVQKNNVYTLDLFDVEHVIKEQAKRTDLEYKNFDLNEILFASDNVRNVWNVYEKNLYDYFNNLIVDNNEKLEQFVNSCIYGVKNDYKLPELLNFITSSVIFENQMQVFELAKYMNEVSNNCNVWKLKGHTWNEVYKNIDKSNAIMVTNKVGRNDNCPCGSGKKYKKCCGKN